MVKIAARLMIMVATVIPERNGLRRRLSAAKRVSTQETPGRTSAERHKSCATQRTMSGAKKARPRRNINMPMTPALNCRTAPLSWGARRISSGATAKQTMPSRMDHDFLATNTGRQTACRAFSSGLIRSASTAGCNAANKATPTPLARAMANSRGDKLLPDKPMEENRLRTVSPTANNAACANAQPIKQPATAPTIARISASATIIRSNSERRMPRQRSVPISRLRCTTDTDTVL